MFKEIVCEIFCPNKSFVDRCLGVIVALFLLVAVGLSGLLGLGMIDSLGITPTRTAIVVVEKKQIVPKDSRILPMGPLRLPFNRTESYQVHFKIDGEEFSPTVEKEFFDAVRIGDKIEVDYGFKRLSESRRQPTRIKLVGE